MVLAAGAIGEVGPVIALSLIQAKDRAPEQALIMFVFAALAAGAVVLAQRGAPDPSTELLSGPWRRPANFLCAWRCGRP